MSPKVERTAHASAVNDRQGPTVGPGKDDQKKNGLPCSNLSKTKRDNVMGPKAKMVATHRATNAR